jgi:catechol 2,3-dioxygenase
MPAFSFTRLFIENRSNITHQSKMYLQIRLGTPMLRVTDLERELSYYHKLGMKIVNRFHDDEGFEIVELAVDRRKGDGGKVSYADSPLLTLKYDPKASKPHFKSAGLFHFAILLPDRKSLASTFLSLEHRGVDFTGFADHLVSESLYLQDPENNGIEIYCDRPREEWHFDENGHIQMDTIALNLDSLVSEILQDDNKTPPAIGKNLEPFPRGATIGHIHLKVTNLTTSTKFYSENLELDLMQAMYGASFLSVGGYHHRLALNTWQSSGGLSVKSGEAGLEHFKVIVSDKEFFKDLSTRVTESSYNLSLNELLMTDPDGIKIMLRYEGTK